MVMRSNCAVVDTRPAFPVENSLGFPVAILGLADCVDQVLAWLRDGGRTRSVVCANPYSIYLATRDDEFSAALHDADVVIPDGVGIILASRLLGGRIRERVTGSDLFRGVNSAIAESSTNRVFLLGSTDQVLGGLSQVLREQYPEIDVVGQFSPAFKQDFAQAEIVDMVGKVNAAQPDVLWVALTAPKQEKWIRMAKDHLKVPFVGAVGAVFEYSVGTVRRPGLVARSLGLEWFVRLVREPRRLWRRTFVAAPWFVAAVIARRVRPSV